MFSGSQLKTSCACSNSLCTYYTTYKNLIKLKLRGFDFLITCLCFKFASIYYRFNSF